MNNEMMKKHFLIPVSQNNTKSLPGDLAMWVFIVMELTVFAIFFIAFAVAQRVNENMFALGRESLDLFVGLFCTLFLIVSSYFVALSVKAIKSEDNLLAKRLLIYSLVLASFYLILKLSEYSSLAEQGFDLSFNSFYTLYFLITGFHFMHVLMGMVILAYMGKQANKGKYSANNCSGFEAGASYWHMIDLLWVIIFFLVYVIH